VSPSVAQGDAGRSTFDEFARKRIFEHAGLGGHGKNLTQRGGAATKL
jgi:hypothetical protein